jgi:hypothetical protein
MQDASIANRLEKIARLQSAPSAGDFKPIPFNQIPATQRSRHSIRRTEQTNRYKGTPAHYEGFLENEDLVVFLNPPPLVEDPKRFHLYQSFKIAIRCSYTDGLSSTKRNCAPSIERR